MTNRLIRYSALHLFPLAGIAAMLAGLLAACQQTAPSPSSPDPVTLQLPWQHQAQFAGYYVAEEEGFYSDENIAVTLTPRGFDEPLPTEVVAAGEAQFGTVGAASFIKARSEGKPLTALAVIYQEAPNAFAALVDSGIERPEDFVGRRVGMQPGNDLAYAAMMTNLGVDTGQIEEVEVGFDVTPLYNGEVDVMPVWIINEANTIRQEGYDINVFLAADYGVNVYSDVLFTTTDLIEENPALVRRVVSASLKGWQAAIEDEQKAIDMVMRYLPEGDRAHQEAMLNTSIRLINPGGVAVGAMDPARWQETHDILLEYGVIDQPLDVESLYTLDFVQNR